LVLTNCALVGESTDHRETKTIDHQDNNTLKNDFDDSVRDKDTRKTLVPPSGHPWHRWASSSIDARPLIRELELIDKLSSIKEVSDKNYDGPICNLGFNTTYSPRAYRTMVPFVIQNGKALYSQRKEEMLEMGRWKGFSQVLVRALELAKRRQDKDPRIKAVATQEYPLILNPSDFTPCNDITGDKIPIFGWDTLASCEYSWPIPDYKIFDTAQSAKKWDRDFASWERDYPWASKLRKAVWRGTMNGGSVKDWREMPRAKLVQRSLDDRNRTIDAAFAQHSNLGQLDAKRREQEEQATNASMTVPRMSERGYMKYRAILDTDGNAWSGRFGPIMCYNSVVIKIESEVGFMAYYERELKPWEHYIPVHPNLTDLESAVAFAVNDDNTDKLRTIIKNAQSWCRSKLTKDQLTEDMMWTLASYLELLNNNTDSWYEEWQANSRAYRMPSMQFQEIKIS
jgi:hypothetical protein